MQQVTFGGGIDMSSKPQNIRIIEGMSRLYVVILFHKRS